VSATATLTLRLDPEIHAQLCIEAARHGRSVDAEARAILEERLAPDHRKRGLGSRIHERFAGQRADLAIPDRTSELPRAVHFGI
jgi:antitoxin FitA